MALTTQPSIREITVKTPILRRVKRRIRKFLKRTIGDTLLYKAMRVGYRYWTESKRRTTGNLTLKETQEKKAAVAQAIAAPFMQAAYNCPTHGPVYVSGFPNECPKCVVEQQQGKLPLYGGGPVQVRYNGEFSTAAHKLCVEQTTTRKVADYRPGQRLTVRLYPLHLTPLPPTRELDYTRATDAPFLLDQSTPMVDPDETDVRLPRVQKAG